MLKSYFVWSVILSTGCIVLQLPVKRSIKKRKKLKWARSNIVNEEMTVDIAMNYVNTYSWLYFFEQPAEWSIIFDEGQSKRKWTNLKWFTLEAFYFLYLFKVIETIGSWVTYPSHWLYRIMFITFNPNSDVDKKEGLNLNVLGGYFYDESMQIEFRFNGCRDREFAEDTLNKSNMCCILLCIVNLIMWTYTK